MKEMANNQSSAATTAGMSCGQGRAERDEEMVISWFQGDVLWSGDLVMTSPEDEVMGVERRWRRCSGRR
jgi:hypothetical protein